MAQHSLSAFRPIEGGRAEDIFLKESIRRVLYFELSQAAAELAVREKIALAIRHIEEAVFIHSKVNSKYGRDSVVSQQILTGDLGFARAFSLLAQSEDNESFAMMAEVVCELSAGEIQKINFCWGVSQTEEDYLSRIRPTAKFLAACCYLGARIGAVPYEQLKQYYVFGMCMGMAWQITEDIRPDILRKDIRQGVFSLPVLYSLHKTAKGAELTSLLLQGSPVNLQRIFAVLSNTDAVSYAYFSMEQYLEEAKRSIPLAASKELKQALYEIIERCKKGAKENCKLGLKL